ncbi:MAG: hypothetical protein IJX97_04820 [Clostridia bacterium]|nr:hypothetical protein [Clostridia bacterium]
MENKDKFTYTYSAPTEAERREIESIRRQYKPEKSEDSSIERLRRLHSKVTGSATAASLALGVSGLLIFGGGLALVLELGMMVIGIILSAIAVIPIALAYPVYNKVINDGKKRYGDEIIRLSDEILGEE